MATVATITDQVNWYQHRLVVTIIGQDAQANTTRVRYQYYVTNQSSFGNGAWTTLNNVTFHAVINGVDHTATPNFDFRVTKQYLMVSGEQTITHTADGSKTIAISLSCNALAGSTYFQAASASGTMALTALPRQSSFTLTPNPVIEDGEVTIDITRSDPGYTHTVEWESGASSGTVGTGVGTSTTWSPDSALLGAANKVAIEVTVTTFDGATQIGDPVSQDLTLKTAPVYPEIGQGTPYDLRFRRVVVEGGVLVPKEIIPFLEATTNETLSASGACTLKVADSVYDTPLDESVVVADFYDGAQWLEEGLLFVLTRAEEDSTDEAEVTSYQGMSYVDYLLSKAVVAGKDPKETTLSPGHFMQAYFDAAQARGWGTHVDRTFSSTKTSVNTNWRYSATLDVSLDVPLAQLLEGFVTDIHAEYRTRFDSENGVALFEMFNPGYGEDWTVRGAEPIVNLSTAARFKVLDKSPIRKDFSDKLTRVYIRGDEASSVRERASQVNTLFGHLEGTVQATGVKKTAGLNRLGDAVLTNQATGTVERTFSYDLSSTQTPSALFPYRTFRPGDWILVPGDDGPERLRVSQISITRNATSTVATITAGDLIPGGIAATARKLAQSGGGAIAGGTKGAPIPLSNAIPAAPVILSAVGAGFWDESGQPKAGVEVTWSPVSTSLSDTDIDVDLYEVWTREEIGTPWALGALTDDTVTTLSPLDVNATLDIRVRARSTAGVYGEYSEFESIVTPEPSVDIDGPDLADLYTDGVGNIFAVWGGTLDGLPAPARLAYVVAEISDDEGATYVTAGTPIVAAGPIIINKTGAWGLYSVRLRGYDRLGNAGDVSAPQDITITDPHIDPAIPEAPTSLTVTAGADWDASGFFPEAWFDLEWVAPTLDVDGDPVTIVGYDIWGFPGGAIDPEFLTSVTSTTARIKVVNGEVWSFQVRASSNYGGVSAFTEPVSETADATIDAPAAPTAPTLSQYAGILRIQWSGGGMVPQVKKVYATLSTDPGGPFTRVGMPLLGAGDVVVTNLAAGSTYYAKIVLEDEMGQTATSAASDGLVLLPITGVTIQTSEVADTGIKMNTGSLTAYDDSGNPTFILDATTGEVWIAPYDAVFEFGAAGTAAETGTPTTGLAISSEDVSFNTFFHAGGVQIRNDQTPLSWWEADADDASLVNFVSPRARVEQRLRIGDYELLKETKTTGSRLVMRYMGA